MILRTLSLLVFVLTFAACSSPERKPDCIKSEIDSNQCESPTHKTKKEFSGGSIREK